MQRLETIRARAIARKGEEAFEAAMPAASNVELSELGDDRILSAFARGVFQAGFSWKVIEQKWPGFEAAFHGFDVGRNALMSDDDLDRLLADKGIVRNAQKILSVRDNAVFLSELAREHGSAAKVVVSWPKDDVIGLYAMLKSRGARLGGMTGPYALRTLGYDGFILSKSVVAALNEAGVIDGAATSKKAQIAVQAAFNAWQEESGESYARISRTLALSVPD
ncbi:DNA-3-methyladenine glycosylase I [Aliiroseovarius sp. KMU-50]|uniref:DNA-3-methyladenine glycosylase I n=1 Tax=Aliiroseovarius salicola TaxID=3009082 RepID=A0ABT4VYF6_9RHOB|nr:DNA-3-methyladenine glycosylase I [Aliiroseovarius sp. KMU-50]MDA5093199.1 DNA-3-methyladenine glycosylase I [Aliiroseovarius sp. KMU-50]